jgi:hypothetical protein
MAWPTNPRLALSLVTFRDQLNSAYPRRSKVSDGYLGDAEHQKQGSASDHNPWVIDRNGIGVVTAGDFTNDRESHVDTDRITDEIQASRDNRIKYVIANGYIMSGNDGPSPWAWRTYTGPNPHDTHMHISVHSRQELYDDTRPWLIPSFAQAPPPSPEADMLPHQHTALMDIHRQISGRWKSHVSGNEHTLVEYTFYVHKNIIDQRARTRQQNEALSRLTAKVAEKHGLDEGQLLELINGSITEGLEESKNITIDVTVAGQESQPPAG